MGVGEGAGIKRPEPVWIDAADVRPSGAVLPRGYFSGQYSV